MYVEGKVKAVSRKEHSFGILLEGSDVWYNGTGVSPFNKGDIVNFEFEVNPGLLTGNWINKNSTNKLLYGIKEKVIEGTWTYPPNESLTTQERIWRAQCLNLAAELLVNGERAIDSETATKRLFIIARNIMEEANKQKYFQ